jgi:hypothetical protein
MGLDMYLYARKYVSTSMDIEPEGNTYEDILASTGLGIKDLADSAHNSLSVSVQAMYWRKANAIHDWFVKNVQEGNDNCGEYEVGREQLAELASLCSQVLADHDLAQDLLPPAEGFFFGGTDVDEWYFEMLRETKDGIDKLLNPLSPLNAKLGWGGWYFEYRSSW